MKIYDQGHDEGECEHTPIRGSIFTLIAKLFFILVFFELIYAGIFYILALGIPLPFDLHHHITLLLLILGIFKVSIQVLLILNVSLSWANNTYYINGKYLVKRTGIINTEEYVYQFDTVRSLTINQSWLGRIFHYGDVILKTSASGGYQVIVTIAGIQNPEKYQQKIQQCL